MGQIETWQGDCLRQNELGVEGQIREGGRCHKIAQRHKMGKWGLEGVATGNRMTRTRSHLAWLVCNFKSKCIHCRIAKTEILISF